MALSMTRTEGVTVFTVTSDPNSNWPPLCQILKSLCYSPVCCSVSQHMRRFQGTSQSALGCLHIMVGLINIGLAVILSSSGGGSGWVMDETWFPYWFGGLFIIFGIMCILSEKFPSPCLVTINVVLNLCGVAIAIASIVLYCVNLVEIDLYWLCRRDRDEYWYQPTEPPTVSPEEKAIMEQCRDGKAILLMVLQSINAVLIVMSALELCLVISSAVLGIKALVKRGKDANKNPDDIEHCKPLLEEVADNPVV